MNTRPVTTIKVVWYLGGEKVKRFVAPSRPVTTFYSVFDFDHQIEQIYSTYNLSCNRFQQGFIDFQSQSLIIDIGMELIKQCIQKRLGN